MAKTIKKPEILKSLLSTLYSLFLLTIFPLRADAVAVDGSLATRIEDLGRLAGYRSHVEIGSLGIERKHT
jgi:hypothetical protein